MTCGVVLLFGAALLPIHAFAGPRPESGGADTAQSERVAAGSVTEWLERAQRTYQTEVAGRLSVPRDPAAASNAADSGAGEEGGVTHRLWQAIATAMGYVSFWLDRAYHAAGMAAPELPFAFDHRSPQQVAALAEARRKAEAEWKKLEERAKVVAEEAAREAEKTQDAAARALAGALPAIRLADVERAEAKKRQDELAKRKQDLDRQIAEGLKKLDEFSEADEAERARIRDAARKAREALDAAAKKLSAAERATEQRRVALADAAARQAEEEERRAAEARRATEAALRAQKDAEAKREAEEKAAEEAEARRAAEAKRRAEDAERLAAEARAKRAEEQEEVRAAEAKRRADDAARLTAEARAKRAAEQAEEKARRTADDKRQFAEAEKASMAAEVEAKRLADEEEARRIAEKQRQAKEPELARRAHRTEEAAAQASGAPGETTGERTPESETKLAGASVATPLRKSKREPASASDAQADRHASAHPAPSAETDAKSETDMAEPVPLPEKRITVEGARSTVVATTAKRHAAKPVKRLRKSKQATRKRATRVRAYRARAAERRSYRARIHSGCKWRKTARYKAEYAKRQRARAAKRREYRRARETRRARAVAKRHVRYRYRTQKRPCPFRIFAHR